MARYAALLFVLALLMATDTGVTVGEARVCESASHRFRGPCGRDSNCRTVCMSEGFYDGDCRGLRRRCFCKKRC